MTNPANFIISGQIVGPHGVAGLLKVLPWCDSIAFLCDFKKLYLDDLGENYLTIEKASVHKNVVLIKAEGINSLESAEKLRDSHIYINRKDIKLEKGQYLIQDLIGAQVQDKSGKVFGKISEINKLPANDVWSIVKEGKTHLFPAVNEFIVDVDLKNSTIIINPIEGIFEDDD